MCCILLLGGCAQNARQAYIVAHNPIMDRNGGVLLLADVCVKRDVVGDDDYFMIDESKAGARAILDSTREYLQKNQVTVSRQYIPFVCGSLSQGNKGKTFKVAEKLDGTVTEKRPPFAVDPAIKGDPQLVEALSKLSADAFRRSSVMRITQQAKWTGKKPPHLSPAAVSPEEIAAASKLVATKMHASSIVYLGVNGTSISNG